MPTRKNAPERHYHGHVTPTWTPTPQPTEDTFEVSLHGAQEVADWVSEALRQATGEPDLELTDERGVWQRLVKEQETISTGLQTGPTITAVAMPEGECWCQRPSLREVSGKHRDA